MVCRYKLNTLLKRALPIVIFKKILSPCLNIKEGSQLDQGHFTGTPIRHNA